MCVRSHDCSVACAAAACVFRNHSEQIVVWTSRRNDDVNAEHVVFRFTWCRSGNESIDKRRKK